RGAADDAIARTPAVLDAPAGPAVGHGHQASQLVELRLPLAAHRAASAGEGVDARVLHLSVEAGVAPGDLVRVVLGGRPVQRLEGEGGGAEDLMLLRAEDGRD